VTTSGWLSPAAKAWEFLLLWDREAVIAVRRELDDDTNVISLGALLDEMAERPARATCT